MDPRVKPWDDGGEVVAEQAASAGAIKLLTEERWCLDTKPHRRDGATKAAPHPSPAVLRQKLASAAAKRRISCTGSALGENANPTLRHPRA
ncbi:hypothetical protein [Rhizobium sp. MHM7A]|uniref:hypothetical protein n=1 Tax=Rhizobium sp. MHM7A TaxID=2583233 RepID=UPI001106B10B|nr:hypothetical protein [Rhizobium sp. MHM7A]TLX13080.1 hypothetical protein FFR93_14510 [Rhizobium sp. MHM7A]